MVIKKTVVRQRKSNDVCFNAVSLHLGARHDHPVQNLRSHGRHTTTSASLSVCSPGNKFQRRTITVVIGVIWLYAALWAVFPLLGWGGYGPEPFGLACSVDWAGYQQSVNRSSFIMSLAVLCTFIPFLVILFSYSGIAWKLHKAYQAIQNSNLNYGNIEKKVTLVG